MAPADAPQKLTNHAPPRTHTTQDHHPTVWFTEDGKRLGNYLGHNGAVSTLDVSSAWGRRGERSGDP